MIFQGDKFSIFNISCIDKRGFGTRIKTTWNVFLLFSNLQPLERGDCLAADVVVLVLEPLEHVVVDLLVELVVDRRVLAHQLQEAVDQQADPEPGLRGLDLVVVEQPVEQLVKNRREVLREETST